MFLDVQSLFLQNDLHPLLLILKKKVSFLRICGQLLSADGSKSISIKKKVHVSRFANKLFILFIRKFW